VVYLCGTLLPDSERLGSYFLSLGLYVRHATLTLYTSLSHEVHFMLIGVPNVYD